MFIGNTELPDFPVILAPMEDITDAAFRLICKEFGADLVYSEFISSEGLIRSANKSHRKLFFHEAERPVVLQIFGHDVDSLIKATQIAEQAHPDIIDINWGCPVKKVIRKGAGAAILKEPDKMVHLTKAVVNATKIPVTVKTRTGWDNQTIIINEITERLQDTGIKAICVHGRTAVQMYRGNADWEIIHRIKNNQRIMIPVIGNGDISSGEQAKYIRKNYSVDGIMIGRAAVGNPWIFSEIKNSLNNGDKLIEPDIKERLKVLRRLVQYSIHLKGEKIAFIEIRKHYSGIFKSINNFKEFKKKLMAICSIEEFEEILSEIEHSYSGNKYL